MKKLITITLIFLAFSSFNTFAQNTNNDEHGGALNLGLGVGGYSGYYGYIGRTLPVFNINYEFGVANSFTLAPFVTFYSYHSTYYRETVIPIGVKGSYYFDRILNAGSNWDFYLAGSLGFAIINSTWDSDYHGDRKYKHNTSSLFLDIHAGTEYHLSNRVGLFLDLSSGVSTIGLAIH